MEKAFLSILSAAKPHLGTTAFQGTTGLVFSFPSPFFYAHFLDQNIMGHSVIGPLPFVFFLLTLVILSLM